MIVPYFAKPINYYISSEIYIEHPSVGFVSLAQLGGIYVIGRAKQAPHCGIQSRFRMIYMCRSVGHGLRAASAWTKKNHSLRYGKLKERDLQRLKTEERKAEHKTQK